MPDAVAAIHQPNFFPWLGYFDKINRADVFVFLDDAQFPKTGGTWSNRVKIARQGQPVWFTAPVHRGYSGLRNVNEMTFSSEVEWRRDRYEALNRCYSGAAHFAETMAFVGPLLLREVNDLTSYNIQAVDAIVEYLGIARPEIVVASDLALASRGTQRLIDICSAVGCNAYLSGGGAQGYQDEKQFEAAGLHLTFQNFAHPSYRQEHGAAFIPGLSIIDPLMNCGRDAVAAWFRCGGDRI